MLEHARRVAGFLPDLYSIDSLSDAELRTCWEFRKQFMGLKPHVSPEADWDKYRSWIRTADLAWLPLDGAGALCSTCFYKVERRVHEGRTCILLWPEYIYTRAESRKGVGMATGLVAALALAAYRAPLAPLYVVGTGYVPSYLALCQVSNHVYLSEDPAMSEWERSLYRALVTATPGYQPEAGVVNMGTVPRSPRTAAPSEPFLHQAWQRYLEQNPHWTEGYTCMVFGRIQWGALLMMSRRILHRLQHPRKPAA